MRIVNLSDQKGNVKKKYVGYSFGFLFFGPFYLITKLRFVSGILLLLLYFYLLPLPGMELISDILTSNISEKIANIIVRFLIFFRGDYAKFVGIGIVLIIQVTLSIFMEGFLLRKLIKKQKFLPITEEDARLLISIFACNHKVPLASSKPSLTNTYDSPLESQRRDVPYIITEENTSISKFKKQEKRRKIEELNELYNLGQMTREEYEIRRAEIVNTYK